MSDARDTIDGRTLHETKLHIKLTNKGKLIYDGWSDERLLSLLKDKLTQRNEIKSSSVYTDTRCDPSLNKSLRSIIHSGIYNECILLELEEKGMSPYGVLKAIKYGLLGLTSEELKYFQGFGVERENENAWIKKLDEKLIWNLAATGLSEDQCWAIVTCGLISQDENVLYRLLSSGVDVPGILDWPGKIKSAAPIIIRFLKKLGIDEDTLRYVEENGIDDEVEDILSDLGYNEYKEKEALEVMGEILCDCSLTILEEETASIASDHSSLKTKIPFSSSLSNASLLSVSLTNLQYNSIVCTCCLDLLPKGRDSETLKKKDYLRQNVMVPLSWAISRALKYQPSDPNHYIAHQLLRWKYGNVPQEEVHNAQQFVASATIIMDRRLAEKRKRKKEDAIRRLNEAAAKGYRL